MTTAQAHHTLLGRSPVSDVDLSALHARAAAAILPPVLRLRISEEIQGFLRFPDTNGREIVFTSEGDLWIAPITGGIARRVTADDGEERFAHFSADGGRIAFSGQYGGNLDVFVIPAEGGVPKRLTYHPTPDQVIGWTPDGWILFRSRRDDPDTEIVQGIARRGSVQLPHAAALAASPSTTNNAFNRYSSNIGGSSIRGLGRTSVGDLRGRLQASHRFQGWTHFDVAWRAICFPTDGEPAKWRRTQRRPEEYFMIN
jgi:hypothetical protein